MMKKITILVPAYNEALNLPNLLKELHRITKDVEAQNSESQFEWEFLFINDGSKDDTLKVLRNLRRGDSRVNIVNLSRNFGKENAMLAGMDYAQGDAVIIMDADLQDPVSVLPEMVYWWRKGYDDVYGKRKTRGKESWLRKQLSLLFYRFLQGTTRIEILQNVGDFRLLDRRIIDSLKELRETQRYTKGLFCWVGYNKKEVIIDRDSRSQGKSSFTLRSLFNLAIEGITCFTTSPLRLSSIMGFLTSLAAIIYICVVLIKTIFWGEPVKGFPTLLCIILLLGGVQLVALGIIGEYIARIFNETKGRPPYIVESYNEEGKRIEE